MKSKLLLGLFIFSITLSLGQMDSKITTGVITYQQGDHTKALSYLDLGLGDLKKLKAKNIPKGYYYQAKALIGQYQEAVRAQNALKVQEYLGNYAAAFESLKAAEKHDDGKWGKKVEEEKKIMHNLLLQQGLAHLNLSYSAADHGSKKESLEACTKNLTYAIEASNNNYVAYDLLAQAQLSLKDTANAKSNFIAAIEKFNSTPPAQADQLCAYMYYRLALIQRYGDHDLDGALASIHSGQEKLDEEHSRLKASSYWSSLDEPNKAKLLQQYNNGVQDLSNFELDLYLNAPDKMKEALMKFNQAIKDEPDNYMKHCAYAGLLEKVNKNEAIEIYKRAIQIDDQKTIAPFNLGALYNNLALEQAKIANDIIDYKEAQPYFDEFEKYLAQAYTYFKMVYAITPNNETTLKALRQCALQLEKMDDYKEYTERLKSLGY